MTNDRFHRVILITLDGVGIGALPDAADYGDSGADTLGHVAKTVSNLRVPHMQRLGLGNIAGVAHIAPVASPCGGYGRMHERSAGKDTTTGHWELCGLVQTELFPTYPQGFPAEIMAQFTAVAGVEPLGNIAASGTEIIRLLGEAHLASGRPIVYTSSDSVFQIAAHESILPPEQLYALCRSIRKILDPYRIGRVIARPFIGTCAADFKRTARRHDFSMPPNGTTLLDVLCQAGLAVYAIGKIGDIFAGRGITRSLTSDSNRDGMRLTTTALHSVERGLIFTNLVDFDMLYGHRRDAFGFAAALEEFDAWLPELFQTMRSTDLLIITADHGCDPTAHGTDHTREAVPLLIWSPAMQRGIALGQRQSFTDVAATIGECLGVTYRRGESLAAAVVTTLI